MHINRGVHDASQVLKLACVPLEYELKININFFTIRFQVKWNELSQVNNSGPFQQTMVKQTSVIATPYVLITCKIYVFYTSCGEGEMDSMKVRKIQLLFAITCSHASEVSRYYLLVWKCKCCMRETSGTMKFLPKASAASRHHQGGSAVWHGDTGNLPQYRFAGTRKKKNQRSSGQGF